MVGAICRWGSQGDLWQMCRPTREGTELRQPLVARARLCKGFHRLCSVAQACVISPARRQGSDVGGWALVCRRDHGNLACRNASTSSGSVIQVMLQPWLGCYSK